MGTMLFEQGLDNGEAGEAWNLEFPEKVLSVHQAYIEAGSQIILTNTFGGTRYRLGLHKLEEQAFEINRKAAEIALEQRIARLGKTVEECETRIVWLRRDVQPEDVVTVKDFSTWKPGEPVPYGETHPDSD